MGDKSPLSPASTIKQRAELGHTTDMRLLTATGKLLVCTVKVRKPHRQSATVSCSLIAHAGMTPADSAPS